MDDLLRVVLVLFGLFYLAASVFALRAVAMDRLLTNALAALSAKRPAPDAAERLRHGSVVVSALLIGAGALSLLTLLATAPFLLAAATTSALLYVCILAPRFVDPLDPPTEGSRARSVLQTATLGAVSLLAFAASQNGILSAPANAPWRTGAASAGFAFLCGYAVWILGKARLEGSRTEEGARTEGEGPEAPAADEPWELPAPYLDPVRLAAIPLVLTPSWGRLGILDAGTGEPLSWDEYHALLTDMERGLIEDWQGLFRSVADPADPRRAALTDPDGVARLDVRGRPIFEMLAGRLGRDRVSFEPGPRPVPPRIGTGAVKVMADHACDPLWFHDEERVGCFPSADFGLSWRLTCALSGWAVAFDEQLTQSGEPSPGGEWSEVEAAAHDAEGRDLARQLAAELAATGRGHVRVLYHPIGGAIERIAGPAAGATQPGARGDCAGASGVIV